MPTWRFGRHAIIAAKYSLRSFLMFSRTDRLRTAGMIFLVGLVPRLVVAIAEGESGFLTRGYTQYVSLVREISYHGRYCLDTDLGTKCAFWPPVYPAFLTILSFGGETFWPVMVLQAVVGAATAVLTFYLGSELFDRRVGVVAGVITALYPYFVEHDVQLQDTCLTAFVTAVAVYLTVIALKRKLTVVATAAGIAIGAAVLTRATLAPYVALLTIWMLITDSKRAVLIMALVIAVVSPWLVRNYLTVGAAELTSQTGRFLWIAHNDATFSHYPNGSIDESETEAMARLSAGERASVFSMGEAEQSAYFSQKAKSYIVEHKQRSALEAAAKVWAGFSPIINPSGGRLRELVFLFSYGPVLLLGVIGMAMTRLDWRALMPIYLLFANFVIGTAAFWAHSSHRSYLDPYLIIFAAVPLAFFYTKIIHHPQPLH